MDENIESTFGSPEWSSCVWFSPPPPQFIPTSELDPSRRPKLPPQPLIQKNGDGLPSTLNECHNMTTGFLASHTFLVPVSEPKPELLPPQVTSDNHHLIWTAESILPVSFLRWTVFTITCTIGVFHYIPRTSTPNIHLATPGASGRPPTYCSSWSVKPGHSRPRKLLLLCQSEVCWGNSLQFKIFANYWNVGLLL